MSDIDINERHRQKMQKQKERVDAGIKEATTERGVFVFLTGSGKGKSSSAFGMVLRALGYGQKVGVIQFIKGNRTTGESLFFSELRQDVDHYQMGTGFTWDSQDRERDIAAAEKTWEVASRMLSDDSYDLVLLDELTYMLGYKYLNIEKVLDAIKNRPVEQSVIVTGRGGGAKLRELADTVSEVKEIKHAFKSGIKARPGVDL
ncbi:MAG: cob(I)yrinic acid a,c-diamide adenosyltransferase [Gammaproteobacteria bacterium]|nr:cob(I)yrinic acid a,c-diamide adenosyltransferase [Gammaproteobacteria bacterium]